MTIVQFIRRFGFFPVAGEASGRRQPVHADDLVRAVASMLENPETYGKAYDLPGGETLSYRSMVKRIFDALNRPPRIIGIPTGLYGYLLGAAGLLGADATADIARRMNQDMVFDPGDARKDFSFVSQGFLQHPERDLGVG
jgi:nucleoside-diphosphate-sugar epimerase